ncbi:hypothetical protein 2 [Changjiang tombus-like virus 8]|uniref:hypothetical protein 2 n=1 Tax=Changjiang tombus-like virus 8 TaxID=1922822 RepID=UPI00090BF109|nr:hypothetical protein 2 [Changjiang tombus-like virus 8]APG76241.1 hypothetical protein 2 [Changjiang tombus-like virus 8]
MVGRDLSRCRGMLRLYPNGQAAKARKFVVVRDLGPTHHLGVYNNNIRTVGRAFEERYFLCDVGGTFEPALHVRPRAYQRNMQLQRFKESLVHACANAPVVPLRRVVEAYTGSKRRVYEDAYASLQKDPITQFDAALHSFVKYEKQDLRKAPRVINPRSPRYNLTLGKYIKFLEKRVYRAINGAFGAHTSHTVIKGLNVMESGAVVAAKWARFCTPVAVGLDAKKFDMHTSIPALRYEHSVYTGIFPQSRELAQLLRWQEKNKGNAYCEDGVVKFSMEGTRSSGDLNTSLGNCIIMCGLVYAYSKQRGVNVELCNNGDDCVVIMEAVDLAKFLHNASEWFTIYGYRMTIEEPVYELEHIEFCQSKVVRVGDTPVMVRNLTNSITKDPMCLVPVQTPTVLQMWYRAVGDCGLSISSGVPVLQAYYALFQRHGKDYSDGFMKHVNKNTSHLTRMKGLDKLSVCAEIDPRTRCSFYYAFGILPELQMQIEQVYSHMVLSTNVEELLHEGLAYDKYDNNPPCVVQYMF